MNREIGAGWSATTKHAASSYGLPVYVRDGQAHSLAEFIAAGGLRQVRDARGLTQATAAAQIGVEPITLSRWERGVHPPLAGMIRRALEAWLAGE